MAITVKELVFPEPSKPGIIQFLAACTVPRLAATSVLRFLPNDVVQRITRFAHPPPYLPAFPIFMAAKEDEDTVRMNLSVDISLERAARCRLCDLRASCIDVTDAPHDMRLRMANPILVGAVYVEVELTMAWFFAEFVCVPGGDEAASFGMRLDDKGNFGELCVDLIHGETNVGSIAEFDETWDCFHYAAFGFFVDMNRGCVTLCFNGRRGPCVPFPETSNWQRGVYLDVRRPVEGQDDEGRSTLCGCSASQDLPSFASPSSAPAWFGRPSSIAQLLADGELIARVQDSEEEDAA